MACCVLKISKQGRSLLSILFTTISVILFAVSLSLVVYGTYIICAVAPDLPSEQAVITLIFGVIVMDGLQLAIFYIVGIKVCHNCHNNAHTKKSRYILKIWNFSGYCVIINVLIIGTISAGVSNHIIRSMHYSMERGMRRYLKKIRWKTIIDNIQYQVGCCGSRSYKDWYNIPWMQSFHLNIQNGYVKNYTRISGEDVYATSVPWSCCNLKYEHQCLHDPIQQYRSQSIWEEITDSIYTEGCVEVLRKPIEQGLLLFILASYFIFILQIIMTIISQLLYTSFRNSVILGDPMGSAPGWIMGPHDYNYEDKHVLTEQMNSTKRKKKSEAAETSRTQDSTVRTPTTDTKEVHTLFDRAVHKLSRETAAHDSPYSESDIEYATDDEKTTLMR